ncbi:hypothetical protein AVEN_136342-1 [Araneus ventricosus]|uniref:Uncharacterized protein n=1 Tax=Araneus ventricosus TaxID=182803 RepID=A0A4Y2E3P4_ARAVE|nr:hypothetical protein AVEN_136342-1 [Araneus ventricosus]
MNSNAKLLEMNANVKFLEINVEEHNSQKGLKVSAVSHYILLKLDSEFHWGRSGLVVNSQFPSLKPYSAEVYHVCEPGDY